MADYWKSQPRKFCEICKCWMADNKPSRDFHERGKRHQDNMKKRLDDMRRKKIEDSKKDREVQSYLMEMERGAMMKFKQDLAGDPKLAAKYGMSAKSLTIPSPASYSGWSLMVGQNQQKKPTDTSADKNSKTPKKKKGEAIYPQPNPNAEPEESVSNTHGDWQEVMTDDGHLYYWNSKTGESAWFLPGTAEYDDYIKKMANIPAGQAAAYFQSYQAQNNHSATDEASASNYQQPDEYHTYPSSNHEETHSAEAQHSTISQTSLQSFATEHREFTVKSEHQDVKLEENRPEVKPEVGNTLTQEPGQAEDDGEIYKGIAWKKRRRDNSSVYGQWQEVKPPTATKEIDLQLPENKKVQMRTIVVPKEAKFVIKEKTVEVSRKPPVDFKKKSEGSQNKSRNLRKRACDDDI